jgi:poly(3-hydroxybutyrate) depolymerase
MTRSKRMPATLLAIALVLPTTLLQPRSSQAADAASRPATRPSPAELSPLPTTRPQRLKPPLLPPTGNPVTRADMAAAYVRFEQLWRLHPPTPARLRELNNLFDAVTYLMIRNDLPGAIRMLNDLSNSLLPPQQQVSVAGRVALSLRVRVEPTIALAGRNEPAEARITPLYPLPEPAPLQARLTVRVATAAGAAPADPLLSVPLDLPADRPPTTLELDLSTLPAGRYAAEILTADGQRSPATSLYVVERSLEEVRVENEQAAAKLDDAGPLRQAIFAFRARNRLLADRVFEGDTTRFLTDPITLREELAGELAALQAGRDPYVRRVGDYWRAFLAGATGVPARVYVPRNAAANGRPLPLVIALHGMGGDENMFMDGYGGGVLKRLADERGFILVTPSTYTVAPNPAAFVAIVDTMSRLHDVDPGRVYVLGHSLGAMVAGGWAVLYHDRLAAAALIAGGQVVGEMSSPALMVAGEADSLFTLDRLRAAADRARGAGLPVEFMPMINYGHVLLVGDAMPEITRWLLTHTLDRRPTTQKGDSPPFPPAPQNAGDPKKGD